MTTQKAKIISAAIDIIKENSNGVRWSELLRKLKDRFPDTPRNSIKRTALKIISEKPDQIYKPERGLFRHIMFKEGAPTGEEQETIPKIDKIIEENFYQPFADWLIGELEECTKAIPLGGKKFQDKWGTPDVIGKRKSRKSDIIQMPTEIISAEIKTDTSNLITAFGQACSYKLFSHKSYIVIPRESPSEDMARIDALCRIFGIGLIIFDSNNPEYPQFEIRVRSNKHEPDMFYVNEKMKLIEKELFL
jgi:hypothetical protein